jgi:hypothetical protein
MVLISPFHNEVSVGSRWLSETNDARIVAACTSAQIRDRRKCQVCNTGVNGAVGQGAVPADGVIVGSVGTCPGTCSEGSRS